jgi:hypothetical protein
MVGEELKKTKNEGVEMKCRKLGTIITNYLFALFFISIIVCVGGGILYLLNHTTDGVLIFVEASAYVFVAVVSVHNIEKLIDLFKWHDREVK